MECLLCRKRRLRDGCKTLLGDTTEGRWSSQCVARAQSRLVNQLLESWIVERLREALAAMQRLTVDLDGWSNFMSRVNRSPVGTGVGAIPLSPSNAR
jgi:hypothetical protein